MKVIPVLDLLNGSVVHAVRGQRSQYMPIKSVLSKSADPAEVAASFKALGFSELYVADLDAIIDCTLAFPVVKRIAAQTGLSLMVDAGVTSLDRAQRLLSGGASKLVVGTETLQSKSFISEAIKRFGANRVVVSLDMKGTQVVAKAGFDGSKEPLALLEEFRALGVEEVIVLDLLRVGSGEGVNVEFIRQAIGVGVKVVVGGGVRGIEDLVELRQLGASGALVASALHSGKITVADLKAAGMLP
ncbi:MAG: HisA/HisF-related TIM barrel protein [Candidatus Bathyarchaeota archaeon]|nr:HisA/HisF-related TIM barrel protein [Candidatus Bathyarchaeota archaeon]